MPTERNESRGRKSDPSEVVIVPEGCEGILRRKSLQSVRVLGQSVEVKRSDRDKTPLSAAMDFEGTAQGQAGAQVPARTYATLEQMYFEYERNVPNGVLAELAFFIEDAKRNPPEDKAAFVHRANRLMDLFNVQLRVNGRFFARLTLNPGSTGRGYISFSTGSGSRGGFQDARLELVRRESPSVR